MQIKTKTIALLWFWNKKRQFTGKKYDLLTNYSKKL